MELTFYTNPMSRGRIVRWMLEEVGAPYETVLVGYGPTMKAPDYLAINPMGKVPALRHGPHVVTEGAAICAYLADAFPEAGLAPSSGARADYYRWLFFGAGPIEAAVTAKGINLEPPAEKAPQVGFGTTDLTFGTLADAVAAREWLGGDAFSAADVYCASQVMWGLHFGLMPKLAPLEAYVARATARPAFARAAEKDDAAAKTMPTPGSD
ncbi:MAG: glutathione S-transferase family protein [Pseudomonadota bacterium]